MNSRDLYQSKYKAVKHAFLGKNQLFDCLGIDASKINYVQQYEWLIQKEDYQELKSLKPGKHMVSRAYRYQFDEEVAVSFHLRCYRKYSLKSPKCAIFIELDVFPKSTKRLRIEIDIKCRKKEEYRQLLSTQIMSPKHRTSGFQAFEHEELERNQSIEWVVGMKIFKTEQFGEEEMFYKELQQNMMI